MKYILKIDGMHCGMCEAHVNDLVRKAYDVKKVKSSHKKGLTTIITKEEIDIDIVAKAISDFGYKVTSIEKINN